MSADQDNSKEIDLDRTDRLPVLQGVGFDSDSDDDATPTELATSSTGSSLAVSSPAASALSGDFIRSSAIDLPSLAESVRSVEERIARQNAEYETLNRTYARARDAEGAATSRANALERDLAAARTALEAEQARVRENEKVLAERSKLVEAARTRAEETLRERERYQTEARTLRDSLATRDATIVQVLHSLGERDAQLNALQQEHSKTTTALDSRSKTGSQLEADLSASRSDAASLEQQLKSARETAATLSAQLKRSEADVSATRAELGEAKTQSSSYLEVLRTREWRSGFDLNLFREMDAQIGAADSGLGTIRSERDRLQSQVTELEARISAQDATIEKLQTAAASHASTFAQQAKDLKQAEGARADLNSRLTVTETDRTRLSKELAAREQALADTRAAATGNLQRVNEMLATAEQRHAAQVAEIAQLQNEHREKLAALGTQHASEVATLRSTHANQLSELKAAADAREQEMTVLVTHLQEARRPVEVIEADVRRLKQELEAKTTAFDTLTEEAGTLRSSLERTRGALEEREFLIRRLERSESNNANVLGRIQTSMERLGAPAVPLAALISPATDPDALGEMIRVEGEVSTSHRLSRRTRIGRAPGCELQVDSSSVSRHHALILAGPREAIIEDLNSTNGVVVNGRKVSRHLLRDGDSVIIGEIHFRYALGASQAPVAG